MWLGLIYFVTATAFWLIKYLFQIDGDNLVFIKFIFIAQISHYGKLMVLDKLTSIVLQLVNQIK